MKVVALAAALAVALPAPASVAGPGTPRMQAKSIHISTAEQPADSGGIAVPLVLLFVIAAAMASGGGGQSVNLSDARLKTGIVPIGSLPGGLTLYQFSYRGLPQRYSGVMAQEVQAHRPDAVATLPGGILAVDYAKLGLRMRTVD